MHLMHCHATGHAAAGRRLSLLLLTFAFLLAAAPQAIAGGGGTPKVVTAANHTCALADRGEVLCWGLNTHGQLGTGDTIDRAVPTPVPGLTDVKSIGATAHGTCAVKHDGTVWCWGANDLGQLGQGGSDADPHPTPVQVVDVHDTYWVTGGDGHVCSVTWEGYVSCWGSNSDGQLANGAVGGFSGTATRLPDIKKIHSITTGANFTCISMSDKTVRCAGANLLGQLGNAALGANSGTLVEVPGLEMAYEVLGGGGHVCSLTWGKVQVRCWGDNSQGQVAQGTTGETVPRPLSEVTSLKEVKRLGGTNGSTCALTDDRALSCWGDGSDGRLGAGSESSSGTPVAVGLTNVAAVSAGSTSRTQCAIQRGGVLSCWGANDNGQAGTGASSGPVLTPFVIPNVDLVTRPQYPESAWIEPTSQLRRNPARTMWRLRSRLTVEPSWFVDPAAACKGRVAADVFYWRKVRRSDAKSATGDHYEKKKVGVRVRSKLRLVSGHCKADFVHRIPIRRFASKKKLLLLSATGFGNEAQSKFYAGDYELKNMNKKK